MLDFEQTCGACPEQYDVLLRGCKVGYLRLRYGSFTVQCPDAGGDEVYHATVGDAFCGVFPTERLRRRYLREAGKAIRAWHQAQEEA